ncbi:hypothetical protein JCM19992_23670 [Thermostilla marina]
MNIRSIEVERFGIWRDLVIEELSPGLNVFYGRNEAGKTTLLEFLRAMWFGMESRSRYLFEDGGALAGSLVIRDGEIDCRLSRRWRPGEGESVRLLDADGDVIEVETLETLLHGIDEPTFNHVFAVGLDELASLRTLDETQAAELLYDLSLGVDRGALGKLIAEIEQTRRRLFGNGEPGALENCASRLEELAERQTEYAAEVRAHIQLVRQAKENEQQIAALEEEAASVQKRLETLKTVEALLPRWRRYRSLAREIKRFDDPGPTSELVELVEQVRERLYRSRENLKKLRSLESRLRKKIKALGQLSHVLQVRPQIDALVLKREWLPRLKQQIAELEMEADRRRRRLEELGARFGVPVAIDSDDGEGVTITSATWKRLRGPGKRLGKLEAEAARLRAEAERAEAEAVELEKQLASVLSDRPDKTLSQAIDRLGKRASRLRRRIECERRLEETDEYAAELDRQIQQLLEEQGLSVPVLAGIGAGFIVGAMLILFTIVSAVFSQSGLEGFGIFTILAGAGAMAASIAAKFLLEREARSRLEQCRRRRQMLDTQRAELTAERAALEAELGDSEWSWEARLKETEEELAALDEFSVLEGKRAAAEEAAESRMREYEAVEARLAEAKSEWAARLKSCGLPADLTPGRVAELFRESDEMAEMRRRYQATREELTQKQRELETLVVQIRQVADAIGVNGDEPNALLTTLEDTLKLALEKDRIRKRLRERRHSLRRKRERMMARIERDRLRLRRLYHEAGASDYRSFKKRAEESQEQAERRAALEKEKAEIQLVLDRSGEADEILVLTKQYAKDSRELTAEIEQVAKNAAQLKSTLEGCYERRGALSAKLAQAAENRGPARCAVRIRALEWQKAEYEREWNSIALLERALARVRRRFETRRQPEALREASKLFRRLTRGRYRRVWTPIDEAVLFVDDAQNGVRRVEQLSRGTREQLFLALRLSVASVYAHQEKSLPIVLDDVLVNFDVKRVTAAVDVLRRLAEAGRQILLFTCHQHIVQAFRKVGVPGIVLTEHGTILLEAASDSARHVKAPDGRRSSKKSETKKQRRRQKKTVEHALKGEHGPDKSAGASAASRGDDEGLREKVAQETREARAVTLASSPDEDAVEQGPDREAPETPRKSEESAGENHSQQPRDDREDDSWEFAESRWLSEGEHFFAESETERTSEAA